MMSRRQCGHGIAGSERDRAPAHGSLYGQPHVEEPSRQDMDRVWAGELLRSVIEPCTGNTETDTERHERGEQ